MKTSRKPTIIIAVLILLVIVVMIFIAANRKGIDYSAKNVDDGTVVIDGRKYEEIPNLTKYLIYGVDSYSDEQSEDELFTQCDVIDLLIINRNDDTFAVISIDRDTVSEIYTYDENGEKIATGEAQIAYAHTHGFTEDVACQGVEESVSSLLYGTRIDGYMALDMDSIQTLNNLAGGVSVTIEDDFSKDDPTLVKGETIKLSDEQAESFVRGRMNVGDSTNKSRLKRQSAYLEGLRTEFEKKYREDSGFTNTVFEALEPMMHTNMDSDDLSKIARAVIEDEDLGTFTIEGSDDYDDDGCHMLIPSEDSITDIVTTLIYRRTT